MLAQRFSGLPRRNMARSWVARRANRPTAAASTTVMRIFVTTARFYGPLAEAPAKEGLQSTGAFGSVGNRPGNEKRDRFVPQRPHGRSLRPRTKGSNQEPGESILAARSSIARKMTALAALP